MPKLTLGDIASGVCSGLWRTLREFTPEILQTCVVSPLLGRAVAPLTARAPRGLAQLAGIRQLAIRTVDGAVVEGAVPKAGAKFTIPNGLPAGERRLIIENEPHTVNGFNGKIEEGYGKGTKTLLYHGPVVVKVGGQTSVETADYHFHEADQAGPHFDLAVTGVPPQQFRLRPKQVEIHFAQGPLAGKRFSIVNTIMKEGQGGRMIIPMVDRGVITAKPSIPLKDRTWLEKQNPKDWITEWKPDGSLAGASLSQDRAAFRSHRESGTTYYDKLPSLEFFSNTSRLWSCRKIFPHPSLNGTLIQGELFHPNGVGKMAGILNSNPDRARAYQAENGDAEFYAWDIVKYKGRDVSQWNHARRRGLLEKTIAEIRHYNRNWHIVEEAPELVTPVEFFDIIVSDPRGLPYSEGVVVKNKYNYAEMYKVKASDAFDLPIAPDGFVEGTGKYAGSLGALKVVNPDTGEIGEVGSLALEDAERQWIWDNRSILAGTVAKVRALSLTERGVPRAGVFEGFHLNKGSEEALAVLARRSLIDGNDLQDESRRV